MDQLDEAVAALRAGQAVVVPTDTVYGVAVRAAAPGATAQLFALKRRPDSVPLAVLVADVAQARELAVVPTAADALVARWWPGPVTLVCLRRPGVDLELGSAGATVGLRCPDHTLVQELARRVGPLATTSANRHGQPTPPTAAAAAVALNGEVAVVVDGGRCDGVPSTVLDVSGARWVLLREGPVPATALCQPSDEP